jgi:hypothetical protein
MNRLLVILTLISFAVRGLVPAGWMPTGERSFEITICAGTDTHKVWLDSKGAMHKQDPAKKELPEQKSCGFASLAMAANIGSVEAQIFDRTILSVNDHHDYLVSIGNGLAAPPPPATGPPLLT